MGVKYDPDRKSSEWFLTKGVPIWDSGKDKQHPLGYFDLDLSDYKLDRMKKKHKHRRISHLRFIVIKNCLIRGGFGKGTAVVNGHKFKVTYAWRGRNAIRSPHTLSHSVRLEPFKKMDLEKFLDDFMTKIYMWEEGPIFVKIRNIPTYTFAESNLIDKKYMKDD